MGLMKFVVYRHDNAFGNTAEQILCLSQAIDNLNDHEFEVLVEHEWQKIFCLLIPKVQKHQVHVLGNRMGVAADNNWIIDGIDRSELKIPSYYASNETDSYQCGWEHIEPISNPVLSYSGNVGEYEADIVIQFRERGTWDRRVDGRFSEPQRDVNSRKFKKLIIHLASLGYTVGRIGDAEQTPLPKSSRIIDYARNCEKNLERDIALIANCKLFISTDSALWPIGIGLGKTTLITNIASVFPPMRTHKYVFKKVFFPTSKLFFKRKDLNPIKPTIFSWIATPNSRVLKKQIVFINLFNRGVAYFKDNSYKDLVRITHQLLHQK